jgi:GntR family transcriptional regulator, sialic acid-inducible nan operon repressor
MMSERPIKRRKLYQEVLDRLISGMATEFQPGSLLPSERDLMQRFGVGRPAVREAMHALQQMGLLRISHGERARVVTPTTDAIMEQMTNAFVLMLATNPRGLDELKEARFMLELGLVRRATRQATAADIDRLDAAHRCLIAARGDHPAFIAADMDFHALIAEIAGNAMVASVTRAVLDWLSRFRAEVVALKGAESLTIQEHEAICRAIETGDEDRAALALEQHLARANELYSKVGAQFAIDSVAI